MTEGQLDDYKAGSRLPLGSHSAGCGRDDETDGKCTSLIWMMSPSATWESISLTSARETRGLCVDLLMCVVC